MGAEAQGSPELLGSFTKKILSVQHSIVPPSCRPGFYKAFTGNIKCSKCPPHSFSHEEGASLCHCEAGFFRAEKDPPTMACTRPPSPPRNVMFNLNETSLFLEWSPPSDTGGRKDVTYSVQCKLCGADPENCQLCGDDLRFVPRPRGLTDSSVTVLDFSAHANYTFEIESHNGVSALSPSPRPVAAITVSADQADLRLVSSHLIFLPWHSRRAKLEAGASFQVSPLHFMFRWGIDELRAKDPTHNSRTEGDK
ncbi:hypothetical protein Z043_101579 [Scleropages formosus]|uniref:Fibronectin type-III domain-containing protein n=1 Tax=Scleropages formosus TaxID=113540 RepID=A0A0P7VXW2_SCLFO|nr:hypothetical protein Z043_101579 [Scleropages formosus]